MTVTTSSAEVVVVGAGAAGSAAAVAAARKGASVYLCEAGSEPGGTIAHCLIHTIGGLYDSAGILIHDGLVAEFAESLAREDKFVRPRKIGRTWVLNVCPQVYQRVLSRLLRNEQRLKLLTQVRTVRLMVTGDNIREAYVAWPGHERRLQPASGKLLHRQTNEPEE